MNKPLTQALPHLVGPVIGAVLLLWLVLSIAPWVGLILIGTFVLGLYSAACNYRKMIRENAKLQAK